MINQKGKCFYLQTIHTSYWFKITSTGQIEHVYYGRFLPEQSMDALQIKRTAQSGATVAIDINNPNESLDITPLEYSGMGQGDFRPSPIELQMPDGSFRNDFVFQSAEIVDGPLRLEGLPTAHGDLTNCQTLIVYLIDEPNQVQLVLNYTVFPMTDVIARQVRLVNQNETALTIHKIMSSSIDIQNQDYCLSTFDGNWIKEGHLHQKPLQVGQYVNQSTTNSSSNQHNPGFIVSEGDATQESGEVFGFNLIYSGSHQSTLDVTSYQNLRIMTGIQPQGFAWELKKGEFFDTPQSIMTYSNRGYNGMSAHFHNFINQHIIPANFNQQPRPVLYNHWEATFMDYRQSQLLSLAKKAQRLGAELFVLDDGWFGKRTDDTKGLGDYAVNPQKFKHGLGEFVDKLKTIGLKAGIWVEPEMVNPDSDLYRQHPEFALATPHKTSLLGRNQLALDLCNPLVQDYIVHQVSSILDSADFTYVKWDYNRHVTDAFSSVLKNQGEFSYRYIQGLYQILHRIFATRPNILLESCSSGGNRFDLGMLCFSPQVWTSDDTDPIERLAIQDGLSYLYPLSTMGAHVSSAPHQQTLRQTPLSTRFNVAAFGQLGYELDLNLLNPEEEKEIKAQISFYQKYRSCFQYGRFKRVDVKEQNRYVWQCQTEQVTISGNFQTHIEAAPAPTRLQILDLASDVTYSVDSKPQRLMIARFGELIKHVSPIKFNPYGLISNIVNKHYSILDAHEHYLGTGDLLASGIYLNNQFMGTNYNDQTRLLGDYGSTLYIVSAQQQEDNHA